MGLGKTLAEIDSLSADEWADWRAFFEIQPWGTHALEIFVAQLCQAIYGAAGAKQVPKMQDLMPFDAIIRKMMTQPKTPEELYEAAQAAMGKAGIKVIT